MAEFNNKLIIVGFLLVFALLLTVGLKDQSATGAAVAGQTSVARSLFSSNGDISFDKRASDASSAGTNWMAVETAIKANIEEYAVDMERCNGIFMCESIAKQELDQRTEQIGVYFSVSLISGESFDMERALSTAGDISVVENAGEEPGLPGGTATSKAGCECICVEYKGGGEATVTKACPTTKINCWDKEAGQGDTRFCGQVDCTRDCKLIGAKPLGGLSCSTAC